MSQIGFAMTSFQIRAFAAAGLASATFLVLAGGAGVPPVHADGGADGATPRTARTCQADNCPAAPERIRVGYGNGGSSLSTPATERDTAARWSR